MPLFTYTARDRSGQRVTGTIEAENYDAAGAMLEAKGYLPISLDMRASSPDVLPKMPDLLTPRVHADDMIMFTFQFSTLIGAGIPILSCLRVLSRQIRNTTLKRIIEQAARDIEGGAALSDSLAKHPRVFSPIYINMIRAGEASGTLHEMFVRLGQMIEHDVEIHQQIRAALRYPFIVIVTLLAACGILLTFVLPRFVAIFQKFSLTLPLPTRILIMLNSFVQEHGLVLAVCVVTAVLVLRGWIMTERGRYLWHYVQISVPILGPLVLMAALSRFSYMMATLIKSGLPIIENLAVTAQAVGNDVLAEATRRIRDSVQEGKGLAEPMGNIGFFTPLVVQMVAIGEASGTLEDILFKISRYYDMEVANRTKRLGSYVEPLLTLVLGIMVLFFALAIFLPMWDLTRIATKK